MYDLFVWKVTHCDKKTKFSAKLKKSLVMVTKKLQCVIENYDK